MSYSNRLYLYAPFALLLLLALGYSAYWYLVANRIDAELERLNRSEAIPGVTLAFAEKRVGGFPFRFDITLEGVTLASTADNGATAWRAERIALHAMSYGRALYILEADGLQTFSWPRADGTLNILQVTPGIARASAYVVDGALARFDIDVLNVSGEDVSQGAAPERNFSAARAQLHLLARDDNTMALVASLYAAQIGSGYRPALGPDLSRVRIEGHFTEAQHFDTLRAGTAVMRDALEAWREAGGTLILNPIEAAWGGTQLMGEGTLALDEEHHFAGTISAHPEDPVSFLGALAQSEMIPADARAQLQVFRQFAGAMPGTLDIPIRLEATLPFGDAPVTPVLAFQQGPNAFATGMVVTFRSGAVP
jgi:hypothetical protein